MAGAPRGELLSFRAFQAACPAGCEYGYGGGLRGLRESEFPRLRGTAGSPEGRVRDGQGRGG